MLQALRVDVGLCLKHIDVQSNKEHHQQSHQRKSAAPADPCRLQSLHHEVPLKVVAQLPIIVPGAHP